MTGTEIIAKYELQVDDASELSSDEELELLNDVYSEIQEDRDWEWLKDSFSGSTSVSVDYIALPSDFKKVLPNSYNESVVFVGDDYSEYKVIPFSSRRDYRNQDGFCYIDIPNQRLVFTLQPTSVKDVEYDYIKVAPEITTSTEPLFREGFHKIVAYGMAANFNTLEQTDKSVSYQKENKKLFNDVLESMAVEDANIKLSI